MKCVYFFVICLILAMTMLLTACGSSSSAPKADAPAASIKVEASSVEASSDASATTNGDSVEMTFNNFKFENSVNIISKDNHDYSDNYTISASMAKKIDEKLNQLAAKYPDEWYDYIDRVTKNNIYVQNAIDAYAYAVGVLGESKLSKGKSESFGPEEARELFKKTVAEFDEFLKYNADVNNYPEGALPWMHFLPQYLMENNEGYSSERLGFRLWDSESLYYIDMLENDRGGDFTGYKTIFSRIVEAYPELDNYVTNWSTAPNWNHYAKNLGNAFYNYKLYTNSQSVDSIYPDRRPAENTDIKRYYAYHTMFDERDIMMGFLGFTPYYDNNPKLDEVDDFLRIRSPKYLTTLKGYEVGYIVQIESGNTFTNDQFIDLAIGYDENLGGYFVIDEYDEDLAVIDTSTNYLDL